MDCAAVSKGGRTITPDLNSIVVAGAMVSEESELAFGSGVEDNRVELEAVEVGWKFLSDHAFGVVDL